MLQVVAFIVLASLTVGSAVVVAFSRNVIRATVALLGTFLGVAGLYLELSADFLAASQVLVYVGGTLTLILFAVMLTARISQVDESNPPFSRGVGGLLAVAVGGGVLSVAARSPVHPLSNPDAPSTARVGHAFLSTYAFLFEVASFVLLAALVGAVVIARRAVRR